jgi:hypothetical protein
MKAINKMNRLALKELDSAALILVLQREIMQNPGYFNADTVFDAVNLATFLHRKATRMNRANLPRTPYIEHPLRNTIRLLRAGCWSEKVIIATILHDVLEDCADEILTDFLGYDDISHLSEEEKRVLALDYLISQFGNDVCHIVLRVSNDIIPPGLPVAEKNAGYVAHAGDAIQDPEVYIVKYTDIVDNATGLYHNVVEGGDNSGIVRRAIKYLLIIEIFENTFESVRDRLPINEDAKEDILATLMLTRVRLNGLLEL